MTSIATIEAAFQFLDLPMPCPDFFDFILEKPATRPRDRCGKEQLVYPFVTGSPGSSRVSALAPYSSGDRVGSTLSTPHAGGDLGLFVGECSSPQTDAPKQRRGMSHQRPDLSSHSSCDDPRLKFQIGRFDLILFSRNRQIPGLAREARALLRL